jgi:hypothetical protein
MRVLGPRHTHHCAQGVPRLGHVKHAHTFIHVFKASHAKHYYMSRPGAASDRGYSAQR